MEDECGFPVIYPSLSGDPNTVRNKTNDSEMKTHIIAQHYFSQPCITDDTMLSKTKPSSKSSLIYDDYVLTSESYGSLDTGTKRRRPQKGYISKARHILRYGDPDTKLRFVPSPRPANSTLPPRLTFEQSKAKAAIRRARLAAATAEIEARSARYLAAAPRIPRYWEDPSKKKTSEAAATSTEGQAEAGGPVLKRACEDPKPCAADLIRSTSTMDDSEMKTHIIAQHYFSQPCITDDTMLSKTKPSSKSSLIYDDYVLTSESYGSLDTGTKLHRPQKGYISKARHILRYGDPDPKLRFVPSPRPADSTLPPRLTFEQSKAKAAIRRARLAAATAEIEERSARYLAAAPRIPRYWEDPSKKKASEAAATSTEGQAEAGGPVPKSACQDVNPCAADLIRSTSTMSIH